MKNSEPDLRICRLIAAGCTCAHIRKASRLVTQYYDAVLAPAGVTSTQLTLLVTTFLSQSHSIKDIAESLGMNRTSLTRTLKPMLEQGLVEQDSGIAGPIGDRRIKRIVITDHGKRILRLATPLWEHAQEQLLAKIGETDWQDLIEKLAIVSQVPTVFAD
ncbi:winged helix-turn-helix transcriptional regulator [bacterium]|nr:winged helix-turn-helix transcriptional regulator [bacterium]MBP9807591.1 winged helix-turn-helix transcriptional regulator [bacterium]